MPYKNKDDAREQQRRWRKQHSEYTKEYYRRTVDRRRECARKSYEAMSPASRDRKNATWRTMYYRNRDRQIAKSCEYSKRAEVAARRRAAYADNRDTILRRQRQYRHRPEVAERIRQLQSSPQAKEYFRSYRRKARETGLEAVRAKARETARKQRERRYPSDPAFRLSLLVRNRLNTAIKHQSKKGSAVQLLGCSIPELIVHIERQFRPGMTWQNWGKGPDKWHIDHKRPLASFNLEDPAQLAEACHYANLQPLWELDNLSKRASYKGVDYRKSTRTPSSNSHTPGAI